MKTEIIDRLGEAALLLPARIAQGLAANDRIKTRLSVLQAAAAHGQNPLAAPADLTPECLASGLDGPAMQDLIRGAAVKDGRLMAPGLSALHDAVWTDLADMTAAVAAGDPAASAAATARLDALRTTEPRPALDLLPLDAAGRLTRLSGAGEDSLHRLVMDLHKDLNRLAAATAEELVAGAHAHGLRPEDRPVVQAFMRGVAATSPLKFNHPGLGTTAARTGPRLVLQNDIGETDAHVVVVAVSAAEVTVTYSDVHLARARFFTGLLRDFPVDWSGLEKHDAAGLGDDPVFYLVTGRLSYDAAATRDAFLEALGASLVFQIDWNKARKLLRTWIPKSDAVRVLDWAARKRVGHRAFLELGGADLVGSAVRHGAAGRVGFGDHLDKALGREQAADFLKTVLQVSAETLLAGGSERLARDRIEADLIRRMERVDSGLMSVLTRQAGLALDITSRLARDLAARAEGGPDSRTNLAASARRMEEKGDRIVVEARQVIDGLALGAGLRGMVDRLEQAIDELEQAAFIASLAPSPWPEGVQAPIEALLYAVSAAASGAAAGAAAAMEVPDGQKLDSDDALAAAGRILEAEHVADAAEREVYALVFAGAGDLRGGLAALELARALERASDQFAGFGHLLREHVLADLAR